MRICQTCGTQTVKAKGAPCARCGRLEQAQIDGEPGDQWAGVRLQLQCRGCGHFSPLDQPVKGGSASCLWCDAPQAFSNEHWRSLLEEIHAVVDLGGPDPEGQHPHPRLSIARSNPWRDLGTGQQLAEIEREYTDGVSLRVRAEISRGRPCCPLGHGPLPITAPPDGSPGIMARCDRCGEGGGYAPPDRAYRSLVAVIADAARAGLVQARTVTTGGLVAFNCPGCGAPLPVDGRPFVSCSFCHLTSALPATRQRPAPGSIQPKLWWLAFKGASPLRARLEKSPPEPQAIPEPPQGTTSRWRRGAMTVPVLVLPAGAAAVTGVILFLLMRMGLAL